jgi:molecular chaperone GrpE
LAKKKEEAKTQPQAEEAAAQPAEEAREQTAQEAAEKAELSELEKQKEEVARLNDQLLRSMAEFDNYRKRTQREKETIYPEATAAAVTQFLSLADDFERALAVECSDSKFREGVEMIYKSFLAILEKFAVETVGQPGDTFDPQLHNAVMHVEDESKGEGEIVQVFQKGYRIGDRVLRHAMVQVAN